MVEWRPRFFDASPWFEPIRAAALLFASHSSFPSPEDIDAALASQAGVRFVRQEPRPRRGPRPAGDLYDARIVTEGVVPTRNASWHDLLNALVWATFPRAKRALHTRQHALVVPGAPRRTREQDALAMFDEGGLVRVVDGRALVFGHAIYEGLVLGWPSPRAAALDVHRTDDVDAALAEVLRDACALRTPDELSRFELDRVAAGA